MSTFRANGEGRSPAAAVARRVLALPFALLLAAACASRAPATRVAAARDVVDMWNAAPIPSAPMPPGVGVVARSDWGARPPTLAMRAHTPVRLTIHHTGVGIDTTRTLAQKLVALQRFSQREDSLASGRKKPAWADVPYHFYVAADGGIGAGRDWRYAGDTNTPYDPAGHLLVVVEGNFERDTLTTAQRGALDRLLPALAVQHRISADRLRSHRDYAQTSCPGRDLYDELSRLRGLVSTAMRP